MIIVIYLKRDEQRQSFLENILQMFRSVLSYNRNLTIILTWFLKPKTHNYWKGKIMSRQFMVLLGKQCWQLEE